MIYVLELLNVLKPIVKEEFDESQNENALRDAISYKEIMERKDKNKYVVVQEVKEIKWNYTQCI